MSDQSLEEKYYETKPYGVILVGVAGLILQLMTGNASKIAAGICYASSFLLILMGVKIVLWRNDRRQVNQSSMKSRNIR